MILRSRLAIGVALSTVLAIAVALTVTPARSDEPAYPMIGLGDSIGEGVQSGDSSYRTQPVNYTSLIAQQMGVSYTLPLIQSWAFGNVFSTDGRYRIAPDVISPNRAISGAKVSDLINARFSPPVDTGTDLILMPATTSQLEFAEAVHSPFTVVWIGSNDIDGTILAWNQMDASQLTPLASFTADYTSMIARLKATGSKVVVGTIVDVTDTATLFGPQDLIAMAGDDFGLPEGSFVGAPAALMLKAGLQDASLLQDPNYVLSPAEVQLIQQRTIEFNNVIRATATAAGFAIADMYAWFEAIQANPPVIFGKTLTPGFAGGLICLDQLHPSNTGHALSANVFIRAANLKYGMNIPMISSLKLAQIAVADPFIDWNNNLIVRGRPLAGFLETLGPIFGISGDSGDFPGAAEAPRQASVNPQLGEAFRKQYLAAKGLPASTRWTRADVVAAMREVFPTQ